MGIVIGLTFLTVMVAFGAITAASPAKVAKVLARLTYRIYVEEFHDREQWRYYGFDWQWKPYSREEALRRLKITMVEPERTPEVIFELRLAGVAVLFVSTPLLIWMIVISVFH